MTEYLNVDVQLGPDQLTEEAFAQMQATFPGWTPDEAAIETLLIRIAAAMASDVAYGLTTATTEIFRYYGESVVGLAPKHSEKATVPSLWQVRDGLGHTIEAGTQVVVPDGVGDYVAFEVIDDLTIAPSAPVTVIPPPASVTMQSVEAGTLGNGLYGPAEANDAIAWLDTVTLTSASTGGTDEESDDDYLNRLRRRLQLMAPRPILPDDFAELALDIPAVYRAMARDGYNPEHNL
ncbi:MAG: baseplate J/gp47 family protein, partial [Thermoleophilaceae bacterium]|nr:baseplate J/gp47 family protein [Thermoleophilaceae bacterium]